MRLSVLPFARRFVPSSSGGGGGRRRPIQRQPANQLVAIGALSGNSNQSADTPIFLYLRRYPFSKDRSKGRWTDRSGASERWIDKRQKRKLRAEIEMPEILARAISGKGKKNKISEPFEYAAPSPKNMLNSLFVSILFPLVTDHLSEIASVAIEFPAVDRHSIGI